MKQEERNEREYQAALDALRFSGEGKERIMKNLVERQGQEPGKRRRARALRVALIAACVCLALAGSAGAVQLIAGFQGIDRFAHHYEPDTDSFYQGYTVRGGVNFIPLDQLSQEVLDIAAENPGCYVPLPVSSREKLEELTGLELPARLTVNGYRDGFDAYLTANRNGPAVIDYVEHYSWKGIEIEVKVTLYTEASGALDNDEDVELSHMYPEGWETTGPEEYTTENGLSALVTRAHYVRSGEIDGIGYRFENYQCDALFAFDGARYSICASSWHTDGEAVYATLIQALDSFAM